MTKLTSVVFGSSVTNIGYSTGGNPVFYGCTGITQLTFKGLTVPTLTHANELTVMTNLRIIYVPPEVCNYYLAAFQSYINPNVEFSCNSMPLPVPNLQADKIYSKSVYLSWSKHVNPAVVKYIIRRDGITIGETANCFFTDKNLTTNQTYSYQIYGLTADNAETGRANVEATPRAPAINNIRTDNAFNKIGGNQNNVYIDTVNSKNYQPLGSECVKGLLYYINSDTGDRELIGEAIVNTVTTSTVTYAVKWDVAYMPNGDYTVVFRLTDVDGASTEKEGTVTVAHTGPARIVNVIAFGDILGINISWSISVEIDTTRYRIYRRSEIDINFYSLVTINGRNTLTYRDTTVAEGRLYSYYVVGINDLGQEGLPSEIAVGMKGVDREPPVVTKLTPASGSFINAVATITVTAIDNVGVTKSELYYSLDAGETWALYGSKTGAPYSFALDTRQFVDGVIRIRAFAYDIRNNKSEPLIYIYSIDNTGPEKVTGLSYASTSVTITLSWNDVSDNDISFYRVERKNPNNTYSTLVDVSKTLGANILNLTPETEYIYRVVGYDRLGNRGVPSDDIVTVTQTDTTPPVISSIMPKPGYFANNLAVSITADDDYAVYSIAVQVSVNGKDWTTVNTAEFPDIQKKRTSTYTIDLFTYSDGPIYIRGVATDAYGNVSEIGESAPFVQHILKRSPPAAPTGVQAVDRNGIIEVMWQRGPERDIGAYAVYRSDYYDSGFVKQAGGLATLNYFDRNVVEGKIYYYKVTAIDLAGNESALSAAASAQISSDAEPPRIVNYYPAFNSTIGPGFRTVSIYVTDNRMLDQISIGYKNKTSAAFIELAVFNSINNYEKTVSASIPLDSFEHGDIAVVRVVAIDKAGNECSPTDIEYVVDKEAPIIYQPVARYENNGVILTWQSDLSDGLAGYKIYRAAGTNTNYTLIGQQPAAANQISYVFTDLSIAKIQQSYTYRIDALDNVSNLASFYTNIVEVPNRSMPIAVINCDAVMEVGVDYEIDASGSASAIGIISYAFDFGDGTASASKRAVHRYAIEGAYTIKLTVTDIDGNQSTAQKTILVRSRALLGTVRIRVVDENNKPVPKASVYFDLGEPDMVVRQTDSNGYVTFTAEVGRHAVGCIIPDNEWLPSKKDILVTAGLTTEVTMTMIHQTMIEGSFEIHRMTFDEIIAAGIDVSKPENQYIVNIVVKLTYVEINVTYNPIRPEPIPPVIVGGKSYTVYPIWYGDGGGIGDGGYGDDYSRRMSIIVIEIPITVSTLKDFFNVKLHIINNAAGEFSMLDNKITLNLPDGLTIMETAVSEGEQVVLVPEIPGQTTKTITWILRGDKVGEYWLTADYVGTLAQFNETIATKFVAKDPVQVLGMQGLKLRVDVADEIRYDGNIYYNVTLYNQSGREVYMPNAFVGDVTLRLPDGSVYIMENYLRKMVFYDSHGGSTEINKFPLAMSGGESVTQYFYAHGDIINDRLYVLHRYFYEVGETYGLEIEVIPRPLTFFFIDDPTGVRVAGKVKSYNPKKPTTLKLLQGETVMYETAINSTIGSGQTEQEFIFWGITPGTYKLVVLKESHTKFTVMNIDVGNVDVELTEDVREPVKMITLLCGDINGDGMINNGDLTDLWLVSNYNKSADNVENPDCDLNGDGMVNNSDLTILWLAANYNKGEVIVN